MDKTECREEKQGGAMYYRPKSGRILSPANGSAEIDKANIKKVLIPTGKKETALVAAAPRFPTASMAEAEQTEAPLLKPKEAKIPVAMSDQEVLRHTASLWKYKPIPEDEPEPYEEYITESATLGEFHVTAARVRGKKHKHEGTNCDDWFETRSIGSFVALAVSDGAGSKKFSRIGARASCQGAMECLEKELKKILSKNGEIKKCLGYDMNDSRFQQAASLVAQVAQEAVLAARQNVVNAYQRRRGETVYERVAGHELQLNDFAATFLLTIALPIENSDETFIVTCQVGDGITAAISREVPYEQMVTLLGDADSGAFSGETEFLTSSAVDSLQSLMGRTRVARKKIDVIMSMTDGVADDYDPNGREMLRLYLDLLVNRVLPSSEFENLLKRMKETRRLELTGAVPQPQSYPEVSGDPEPRLVPVQYVRELCSMQNVDLRSIWEGCREHLAVMADSIHMNKDKSPAGRLKEWLDNYVVRGSFDDRTLVILQRGEKDG